MLNSWAKLRRLTTTRVWMDHVDLPNMTWPKKPSSMSMRKSMDHIRSLEVEMNIDISNSLDQVDLKKFMEMTHKGSKKELNFNQHI